ncbi:efflux RND transporter permease subunit [Natranaerobius trueperi]|uniref:Acriflavin resistance protein n=1 Tax=Natranaerobius trueperi TaxID=759412 RepID=A0A226BX66_9FIRM|nr:efflux RND transporter permease subunit [Natranaerobius trueperi]OWZ83511.1 acriflavin resistance protein [Natranaerobius trueperi]
MNLSKIGINRPITVLMVVFMVLIIGGISLTGIPLDLFPDMDLPVLAVSTNYPGAGPEQVENMVTRPLEESLSTLDGLDNISSVSRPGKSEIILMFGWNTDMDFAALDARETIDMVMEQLPDEVENPLTMQIDPNMLPIVQVGMSGDLNHEEMTDLAEGRIQNQLERIEGVASVDIGGGIEREIEIVGDPYKLNAYGLSLDEVTETIAASNLDDSGGSLTEGEREYLIHVAGEFESVKEIKRLIVGQTSGGPVRIEDFAEVNDIQQEQEPFTRLNGKSTVSLAIQSQSDTNLVNVARDVNEELDSLENQLPGNVKFEVAMDQSEYIEESIDNLVVMGISGAIIAMLILWLFLGSARSTLIIGAAIPLSVVCTFILIFFQDFTLNMITLGGLALGIGMMVDNSVVILENIFRQREEGLNPKDAAILGSKEVTGAITAATLTSVVAFLPIVFAEGIADIIFAPMAWTVTFALVSSLIVAVGVIPLLTVKLVPSKTSEDEQKPGKVFIFVNKVLNFLTDKYERVIEWSLNLRGVLVGIVLLLLVLSGFMINMVGTDFLPPMDTGEISVDVEFPTGTPIEITDQNVRDMETKLGDIPEIESVFSNVGGSSMDMSGGGSDGNTARLDIRLVSESERESASHEVSDEIRETLPQIPGANISVTEEDMGGAAGAGASGDAINIMLLGEDLDELERLSSKIAEEVDSVKGTREVTTSFDEPRTRLEVNLDRDMAQTYGLTTFQVGSFLNTALDGNRISTYREGGEEFDINMQLEHPDGWDLSTLETLLISTATGEEVPIEEVASIELGDAPQEIEREDQDRVARINGQLVNRDLGTVMEEIQEKVSEVDLPMDYFVQYGGEYEDMMDAFGELILVLVLAVILVYMVMAAQFESLLYPFIIMFTLPQSLIGVILSLLITGRSLSIVAFIGMIMLAGIVVNNGIVMVDYINLLYRDRGLERQKALLEAGKKRLRPVLMTTLTTIVGMFPLALGIGEGAEASAPMATVVIGGLIVSTLLTLIFVPVMYSLLDDVSKWFISKFKSQPSSTSEGM